MNPQAKDNADPSLLERADAFFTRPAQAAADNLGMFRIAFAVFYLWSRSVEDLVQIAHVPYPFRQHLLALSWLPETLDPRILGGLEATLAGALTWLAFGWKTRWATSIVFALGFLVEGIHSDRAAIESGSIFLVCIPLVALIDCRWGDTHSLDAIFARRSGADSCRPHPSWRYALLPRSMLVALALLFVNAGLLKIVGQGAWLTEPTLLQNAVINKDAFAVAVGFDSWWGVPWVAAHSNVMRFIQIGVLLFELSAFVLLFGPRWQIPWLSLALLFHTVNACWLHVSFSTVAVAYLAFIDWTRLLPRRDAVNRGLQRLSRHVLIASAGIVSLLVAVSWNAGWSSRSVFNLSGLIDSCSVWLPMVIVAATGFFWAVCGLPLLGSSHRRTSARPWPWATL